MFKYIIVALLPFLLIACTAPTKTSTPVSTSGEIPSDAKTMSGYEYPAVPLEQYKKNTMQTGSNPV